ncbi:hypothetical protein Tco_0749561 [Tanacetum coccineum]|uniref:Reverse transcriptase domain-containing protein n=1 Tax=Tanacetum coccineum TaxID=301880 RepID=A0ABQ4Z1N0_9ASTR
MSTTFSSLLDVIPSTSDVSYAIELADRRILETNVILRGCTLGLLVTAKKTNDKLEEKPLEDVPIVRDFLKVFPKDLHGLPPTRNVDFKSELLTMGFIRNQFPHPRELHLVRSRRRMMDLFGCLAGYYRRFIEGFSKIARPMKKLAHKSVKFDWGEKEEAAFQLLKQKLYSAPILALPEGSENFVV